MENSLKNTLPSQQPFNSGIERQPDTECCASRALGRSTCIAGSETIECFSLVPCDYRIRAHPIRGQFLSQPGVRNLDARTFFFTSRVTPAMAKKFIGVGSQYACAFVDADKKALDGSKTYKLHLPPNIPAKNFWSDVVYDNQTRSELQTDQQFPTIGSEKKGIVTNPDTSADVYFGPTAPAGHEANWVQDHSR